MDDTDDETLGDEYASAEGEWRAYCADPATVYTAVTTQPLAVLLLTGLAEPPLGTETFTGDLLADVLTGLFLTAHRWSLAGDPAATDVTKIRVHELNSLERRLRLALELRRRERLAAASEE